MVPEGSGTNSSLAAAKVESRPVPAGGQGAPWNWIAATVVGLAIAVSLVGLDRRWWSRR
jgi:L-arabinose isomerase